LPLSALDLDKGWVNFPRPKTAIERRIPLWPETVAALREALAERPAPKDTAHVGLVFITRWGESWAKDTCDSPISKEIAKLLKGAIIKLTLRDEGGTEHVHFLTQADELTRKGKPVAPADVKRGQLVSLTRQGDAVPLRGTFVSAGSTGRKG